MTAPEESLPMEMEIIYSRQAFTTKSFDFPGGEIQVQIPDLPERLYGDVTVFARLQSPDALIRLILTTEIIRRAHHSGRRRLVIPYFPYARQDRVMQPNEAFSLKAITRTVNGLGYDEVVVCDPHSDVTAALVENVRVVPQVDLVASHEKLSGLLRAKQTVVVAPDAGAAKKAFAVAQRFGKSLVVASKIRDTKTGAITRTEVPASPCIAGHDCVIVDDICDGGRTFIELAKVLHDRRAASVHLYVTHGIFSQGLGVFSGLIDAVYTTDSFLSRDVESSHQTLVPLQVHRIDFGSLCP
jgi:ribose-phosphate pyrophosphokinase